MFVVTWRPHASAKVSQPWGGAQGQCPASTAADGRPARRREPALRLRGGGGGASTGGATHRAPGPGRRARWSCCWTWWRRWRRGSTCRWPTCCRARTRWRASPRRARCACRPSSSSCRRGPGAHRRPNPRALPAPPAMRAVPAIQCSSLRLQSSLGVQCLCHPPAGQSRTPQACVRRCGRPAVGSMAWATCQPTWHA